MATIAFWAGSRSAIQGSCCEDKWGSASGGNPLISLSASFDFVSSVSAYKANGYTGEYRSYVSYSRCSHVDYSTIALSGSRSDMAVEEEEY